MSRFRLVRRAEIALDLGAVEQDADAVGVIERGVEGEDDELPLGPGGREAARSDVATGARGERQGQRGRPRKRAEVHTARASLAAHECRPAVGIRETIEMTVVVLPGWTNGRFRRV